MSYKPGDKFYSVFIMSNISGVAVNADSSPLGLLNRNGADDLTPKVFVTNLDAGRYVSSGIIPNTYLTGDSVQVVISGYMTGNLVKGVYNLGPLDSARLSDLSTLSVLSVLNPVMVSSTYQLQIEPNTNFTQWAQAVGAAVAGSSSLTGSNISYQGLNNAGQNRITSNATSGIRSSVTYNFS